MSLFSEWVADLDPTTDWTARAQDELARAVSEGMPRSQVLQYQNQILEADRTGNAAAAQDVYNVVARWRSERQLRPPAPGDDAPITASDVLDVVAERGAGAAETVRDVLGTSVRATGRAVKDGAAGVLDGAADLARHAAPAWLPGAVVAGGLLAALLAVTLAVAQLRALKGAVTP